GLELGLGADDQDLTAAAHQALEEVGGADQAADRLLQVDDVDRVPLAVDVRGHLRVPAAGAVPEVDAGLDQLLEGNESHAMSPGRGVPGGSELWRRERSRRPPGP